MGGALLGREYSQCKEPGVGTRAEYGWHRGKWLKLGAAHEGPHKPW